MVWWKKKSKRGEGSATTVRASIIDDRCNDESGCLQRTSVKRTMNPDGSITIRKGRKQRIAPGSRRYRTIKKQASTSTSGTTPSGVSSQMFPDLQAVPLEISIREQDDNEQYALNNEYSFDDY